MMKLSFHPLLPALLFILLQFFTPPTVARAEETYVAHACSLLRYTSNSAYETNLHSLMSSLTSQNGVSNGFYKASEGENDQDAVAGYALCRGDVSQSACNSCVNISATDILQMCPTQIGAIAWYENCMLRYSPSFISGYVPPPGEFYYPPADQLQDPVINASDLGKYYEARDVLLSTLAKRASTGNTTRKFATGDVNYKTSGKIYALLQCIPDLDEEQCAQCLNFAAKNLPFRAQQSRALASACDLRVAPIQFYDGSGSLPVPYSLPPVTRNDIVYIKGNTHRYVLVIIVLTVCCMLLIASVCIFLCLMRRKEKITNVNAPRSAVPSPYGLQNIRVDTDDERPERRGVGAAAAAAASKGRPIMEIPMLAAQSAETSVNTGDGTSYTWILKTPVNHPSPR